MIYASAMLWHERRFQGISILPPQKEVDLRDCLYAGGDVQGCYMQWGGIIFLLNLIDNKYLRAVSMCLLFLLCLT